MSRGATLWLVSLVLILLAISVVFYDFNLSAIPEPGRTETSLATIFRHALIRRASRAPVPPRPRGKQASITEGDTLYGAECAACHGLDGRTPTDAGRWMYPRAADLTATDVQQYSDRELFWIVRNGIRLTGMPAFARVETDEHIWNLVDYLRTLRPPSNSR